MISAIGIFFIALSAIFALQKQEWLLPLVLFSSIFQAASIVNSASLGIQPYYAVALIYIFSSIYSKPHNFLSIRKSELLLLGFLMYSVWISWMGPHLFAGMPVYDPQIGLDDNFVRGPSPLQFSIRNIAQCVYAIVNVAVVLCAARSGSGTPVHRTWHHMFWFLASVICLQAGLMLIGVRFPWELINNNQTYTVSDPTDLLRPTGTYSEPSYAGASVAAFGSSFLCEYMEGIGMAFPVLLSIGMLIALGSSSAFGAEVLVGMAILTRFRGFRAPYYINVTRLKKYLVLMIPSIAGVLIVLASPFGRLILQQTINKGQTWSYLVRTSADKYGLVICLRTYGLGVGLGSNRPSGFLVSALSCIGFFGLLLLILFIAVQLRAIYRSSTWAFYAFLAFFLSMCFGIPDLNFPGLWAMIALIAHASAKTTKTNGGLAPITPAIKRDNAAC